MKVEIMSFLVSIEELSEIGETKIQLEAKSSKTQNVTCLNKNSILVCILINFVQGKKTPKKQKMISQWGLFKDIVNKIIL